MREVETRSAGRWAADVHLPAWDGRVGPRGQPRAVYTEQLALETNGRKGAANNVVGG